MWKRGSRPVEDKQTVLEAASVPVIAGRMAMTMLGAAGLMAAPFFDWLSPLHLDGAHLGAQAYVRPDFLVVDRFYAAAGIVTVALGVLALIGLALAAGWLTRLAGALGVVAFALYALSLQREPAYGVSAAGAGAWLALAGSIVSLAAGFSVIRSGRRMVRRSPPLAPGNR